jgi:5-oxoprolinase (ATP-hydrolysing)
VSEDKANYRDAPTEGIRRVLEVATGQSIPRGQVLDTTKIDTIRLSTTVATNALLERKGQKHALVITKGFKNLLEIGNQARPRIFDLHIKKPSTLYSTTIEIDERITLVGFSSDARSETNAIAFDAKGQVTRPYSGPGREENGVADGPGDIVQGLSGEAVRILRRPDPSLVRERLRDLFDQGYRSLAVVLMHSYTVRLSMNLSFEPTHPRAVPSARAPCRRYRRRHRLYPNLPLLPIAAHDQDGAPGDERHCRRLPHPRPPRLPRRLLQRL